MCRLSQSASYIRPAIKDMVIEEGHETARGLPAPGMEFCAIIHMTKKEGTRREETVPERLVWFIMFYFLGFPNPMQHTA